MMTIEKYLELIRRGVDWGRTPFVVKWRSADKRFAIVTHAGGMCWSGIGQRRYAPTEHWVVDLSKAGDLVGYTLYLKCTIRKWEGRLTKIQQRDLEQTAARASRGQG
jgi:hypothetical protein